MTVEEIRRRVDEIRENADDNERAHADEDDLFRDVLCAIAAGSQNAAALAMAVLEVTKIEYTRWHS